MSSILSRVAVFGGSGNLGSAIVEALLATKLHQVSVITRSGNDSQFAAGVQVIRGDLESPDFLAKALQNQDIVVIALGMNASVEIDRKIVNAAALANVKYIIPNEFVSQDSVRQHFPFGIHERKNDIRKLIESAGKSKWISIVNGTWYDYSLGAGAYKIDISERKAHIWTPGNVVANVTTISKVGKCIAALLSLSSEALERHSGQCVFVSSFQVSQLDILHSVQRATKTTDDDWQLSYEDVNEAVQDGQKLAAQGSVDGLMKVIYALQFVPNGGGNYQDKADEIETELQLKAENLDEVTRSVVEKTSQK